MPTHSYPHLLELLKALNTDSKFTRQELKFQKILHAAILKLIYMEFPTSMIHFFFKDCMNSSNVKLILHYFAKV